MSFALSVSLFFIIGVFYIVIVDFYTMLFRITGLTQEKARFQVISLLTNSGYSTTESELVVEVLPRRRLARTIMLFGYIFSITIVSVFVNAMLALPNSEKEEVWLPLLIVCSLFVIFMLVRRIPVVRVAFNTLLEQAGRRWLHSDQGNPVLLQEEFPKGVIAAATLNHVPPDLKDKTLAQMKLPERYGIRVIYLRRDGYMMADLNADTKFQLRDEVVVYGTMKEIRTVFSYQGTGENDLAEAARPEPEGEFIHQQDVENASRAAQAEKAREKQKTAGVTEEGAAPGGAEKRAAAPVAGGVPQAEQKEAPAEKKSGRSAGPAPDKAAAPRDGSAGAPDPEKPDQPASRRIGT